jgi:hypothetical protein
LVYDYPNRFFSLSLQTMAWDFFFPFSWSSFHHCCSVSLNPVCTFLLLLLLPIGTFHSRLIHIPIPTRETALLCFSPGL